MIKEKILENNKDVYEQIVNYINSILTNVDIDIDEITELQPISARDIFDNILEDKIRDIEIIYDDDAIEYIKNNGGFRVAFMQGADAGYSLSDSNVCILASLIAIDAETNKYFRDEDYINELLEGIIDVGE